MPYNSRIILIKIATYYSQNYAGILGSGLLAGSQLAGSGEPAQRSGVSEPNYWSTGL